MLKFRACNPNLLFWCIKSHDLWKCDSKVTPTSLPKLIKIDENRNWDIQGCIPAPNNHQNVAKACLNTSKCLWNGVQERSNQQKMNEDLSETNSESVWNKSILGVIQIATFKSDGCKGGRRQGRSLKIRPHPAGVQGVSLASFISGSVWFFRFLKGFGGSAPAAGTSQKVT